MSWKIVFTNIFTLTSKPILIIALHHTVMASKLMFLDKF